MVAPPESADAPSADVPAGVVDILGVKRAAAEAPFIPPAPVRPGLASDRLGPPDPFRSADLANGAREPARDRARSPSLLEIVTGTGRARSLEAPRRLAELRDRPPVAPQVVAANQQRLSGLDPTDRPAPPRTDDDLLDIPAFLRRQAN